MPAPPFFIPLKLFAGVFTLAFLTGCVTSLSEAEKLACLNATDIAQTTIPYCESQEECLKQVHQSVSHFSKEGFSQEIQYKVFLLENQVAQTWMHANQLFSIAHKVHALCASGNASEIPGALNLLSNALTQTMEDLDASSVLMLDILTTQNSILYQEGVEKIPEEALYMDYVNINNVLAELNHPSTASQDSFVGQYFSAYTSIEKLSAQAGYPVKLLDTTNALDVLNFYDNDFLKKIEFNAWWFPLVSKTVPPIISFLQTSSKIEEAASTLQSANLYDWSTTINRLIGTESSVLGIFSQTMASMSTNYNGLAITKKKLKEEIEYYLQESEQSLTALKQNPYESFSTTFYKDLALLLDYGYSATIASQNASFSSLSDFIEKNTQTLAVISTQYYSKELDEFSGKEPLGAYTEFLKNTHSDAKLLYETLSGFSLLAQEQWVVQCDSKLNTLLETLKKAQPAQETLSMYNIVSYKISSFKEAAKTDEKLLACHQALLAYASYESAIQNSMIGIPENEVLAGTCMHDLKLAAAAVPSSDSIQLQFQKISQFSGTENPNTVLSLCMQALNDALHAFNALPEAQSITLQFKKLKQDWGYLETINSTPSKETYTALSEKIAGLDPYFENGLLKPQSFPGFEALEQVIKTIALDISLILGEEIPKALEKNAQYEVYYPLTPVAGSDANGELYLFITNPFLQAWPSKVELKIPLSIPSSAVMVNTTPNVDSVSIEDTFFTLYLNSLPIEATTARIQFALVPATLKEELQIISANPLNAQVENKISIKKTISNLPLPMLNVPLSTLPYSADPTPKVYWKGQLLPVQSVGENFFFQIKDPDETEIVHAFYSIQSPIKSTFELHYEIQEETGMAQEAHIELHNQSNLETPSMMWEQPLLGASGTVQNIHGADEQGKTIPINFDPHSFTISFKVKSLAPGQTTRITLNWSTQDASAYWESAFTALKNQLNTDFNGVDAQDLLNQLNALSAAFNFENPSSEEVHAFEEIQKESLKIKHALEQAEKDKLQYQWYVQQLTKKINEEKNVMNELLKNGFEKEASIFAKELNQADSGLKLAGELYEKGGYEAAVKKAESALLAIDAIPLQQKLSGILSTAENDWKELKKEIAGIELNPALVLRANQLEQKITSLKTSGSQNGLEFLKALGQFNAQLKDYNAGVQLEIQSRLDEILSSTHAYFSAIKSLEAALSAWEKNLSSTQHLLLELSHIPKLTVEKIQEIQTRLSASRSVIFEEKLQAAMEKPAKGSRVKVLSSYAPLEQPLKDSLRNITELNKALHADANAFKEDANVSLSSAEQIARTRVAHSKSADLIEKSKVAFAQKNYPKSLVFSLSAKKLLEENTSSLMAGIPLPVYPLAFAVLGILAVRYYSTRKRRNALNTPPKKVPRA